MSSLRERVWKGREEGWGQKQEVFSDSQEVRRCRIMKAEGKAHQGDVILQAQVYQERGGRRIVPRGPSLTSEKAVPGEQRRRDWVAEKVGASRSRGGRVDCGFRELDG